MFEEGLKYGTVMYHCDNMSVCYIINRLASEHKDVMTMVMKLVLVLINITLI